MISLKRRLKDEEEDRNVANGEKVSYLKFGLPRHTGGFSRKNNVLFTRQDPRNLYNAVLSDFKDETLLR